MEAALQKRIEDLATAARKTFQTSHGGRAPDAAKDSSDGTRMFDADWQTLRSSGTPQSEIGDCRAAWEVCFYNLQTAGRG